ncbi:trypsin-like peptidase domain-containing protein [Oxalobacteraceae bacterium]|nr:trypsin-like peptidase domain-containing protein [Oxalobacteraceae bacterium]
MKSLSVTLVLLAWTLGQRCVGGELPQVIEHVKPAIVGIGSFQKLRTPPVSFIGTGFAVGDGRSIITAAHVIVDLMQGDTPQTIGVLVGLREVAQFRAASVVAIDREHDLAHLQINGTPLPVMTLGDSNKVVEGSTLAFTGFPLGMALGLHHVTHRGMVSAITPVAMPPVTSRKLEPKLLQQLQKPVYTVFQLDGTAYPGSSGSPLYDPDSGLVLGVINMVYIKGLKESAISNPSGITYAIPSNFIRALLLGRAQPLPAERLGGGPDAPPRPPQQAPAVQAQQPAAQAVRSGD